MPGNLYHSLDLSRRTLHPFNDFTLHSGPLSPPSEGGSPDLARSAWANSSALDSMKMSSPHNARHSPLQELNPQDPYLSAPSDPEEIDFQASAIRLTPVGSSPNHSSSPNDDHEASGPGPAIPTHTGWPSQGTDYVGITSCTSLSDPSGFLAPSDIDLGSGAHWQSGTTAPSTQSAWSASVMANASQWLPPEQTVPSSSSPPGNATAPGEPSAAQHSPASPQQPKLGGSGLAISTDHPSTDGLTSASTARGRSPILLTIETVSRGDSPERGAFAHQRRASRSSTHLSPGGPDEFSSDSEGDIANDDHRSVSSLSVARTHNGNWIRSPATGHGGLEPSARGNEYVLSPNDLESQRERSQKNQDISLWSADVSAASSEAGDDITPPRRRIQASNRLRARSTGDRPLQQEDYFNLQFYTGGPAPGPGVLVHESEGSEDDDASESSVETTSDSLPADANEPGRYDRSTPEVYSSLELTNSSQDFRLYPWQDPPRDAAPRIDAMQPGSSTAAMVAFEKRARDLETASLTATIDNNSIINFSANFERMRISGHPKSKERRSSSLLKRPFIQASNMLKRQASDLSLASTNTGAQHAPPEEPHRKESHRHRLSLSSKQHSRSPSLTNALISMSGQMAAIGGNNAVHAVSPNAEAIPKGFPTTVRGRSRSELPRPVTPGLMDLMTTHGGPPVAGIYRSPRPNTDAEQSRASVVPEPDTAGVEEEEDLEMMDDKGLVMEFPPLSRPPVPTFEGFKAQIMQINPRLEPALIHRFAQEQVRRYKKLVDLQQKHSTAVASHNCKAGKFCFALGGTAALLDQRKAWASSEAGQTQFRITDLSHGRDQPYVHSEGSIAAAQFPPGVPLPPVSHLPAQFECPICFQVKTFQKPSDWTKHVHEDLEPFTCSFPRCNEPKSFKRKADWVRHESERHRQHERWTCAIPECSHTCFRKNNFLQHLVREHKMPEPKAKKTRGAVSAAEGSSGSQRDREADRVERMMVECRHETQQTPSQEPCRFCGNICGSWKKLTVHLGKHMEQLALAVLELAKQSGASPSQAHLTPIPGSSADPNPSSLAGPFHSHHDASNASLGRQQYPTSNTSTPASHHFSYDMPMMNYPSISGTELSMEPDSITDGLQPGDHFPAYGMGQFNQATLHPLHQNSVTYPPPYNAVPRSRTSEANAPMLQPSYPLNSQLHPQDSSLYPGQASYPGYQSVPSNSPYTTTTMPGPYTSSYSSQM